MSSQRGYPYGSSGNYYRGGSGRDREKKGRNVSVMIAGVVIVAVLAAGAAFVFSRDGNIASLLPFPTKLIALRFQHNGQEVLLLPDQQVIVNPRDSLQLIQIKTDGWLSLGTRITSSEMDVNGITKRLGTIRDLFPKESFEAPKSVDLRVTLWNRPIGKVSLLIQLDAKDWQQKANTTTDVDKKIAYLERALRDNASNIFLKTHLAGLYFDTKRYADAARLYQEIDASGKSKIISERLLLVYQIMNKVDDALMVYIDLLKLSEEQQTFKEFITYLKKRKSRDEAEKFLDKHQAQIPRSFQSSVLLALAELSGETKNWSRAAAAYERAIKAGVKDSDVMYNLFVAYKRSDDTDKAIPALERYLQRNSGDIESWLQLAELYAKKGNLAHAKTTYESILQKNPQNKEALTRLIAIMEKSGDKAGLQSAYEKLAQMQPKNRTIQHNLAILYYESKKYDKAIASFQTVAALDPKDVESRKYLLDIHRKLRNEKGEVQVLQELSKIDPKNSAYHDAIYKYYEDKKDYKGMDAYFRATSEQSPDSVNLHKYQLQAALKLGDKKGAARQLEHLIRLQPKEKIYIRKAVDLYEGNGEYAEALKKLDMLLKLDPKDKQAKDDYLRIKMMSMNKKKP
ncbi:MAG: tetratricopeptide repeat protein [Desulfobacteraceae bacterium]|nr:tetratricopeptide repeat protein [Desulfobacteraceae bacterium]